MLEWISLMRLFHKLIWCCWYVLQILVTVLMYDLTFFLFLEVNGGILTVTFHLLLTGGTASIIM